MPISFILLFHTKNLNIKSSLLLTPPSFLPDDICPDILSKTKSFFQYASESKIFPVKDIGVKHLALSKGKRVTEDTFSPGCFDT